MNIVSTIMQLLAPMIINKIAGSLGINQGVAGKAIAALVPAILAGLAGKVSQPGGADALSSALGKQDPGILGNLGSLIGGPGQQSMTDKGNSILGSLLGGSSSSALANATGKFAGLSSNQSSGLMGMLAPVVLGGLAQQQKASNLDAGGLASMLMGQKSNIQAALPAGFADMLSGTGLLDGLGDVRKPAPSPVPSASAADSETTSMFKYAIPAALVAVAAYMLLGRDSGPSQVDTTATPPSITAPASIKAADLPGQIAKITGDLRGTLTGITDEGTAKSALPKLQDIVAQLTTVKTATAALPADAKGPIATIIGGLMPGVNELIGKVLAIPGAAAVLKPVLDQVSASFGAIAK